MSELIAPRDAARSLVFDTKILLKARLALIAIVSASVHLFRDSFAGGALPGMVWYTAAAAALVFTAGSLHWLQDYRKQRLFTVSQLIVDSILTTVAVYATGAWASPFIFLYLTSVILAAVLFRREGAIALAVMNASGFAALSLALTRGWLLSGEHILVPPVATLALQLVGLLSAMFLLSVLTSLLMQLLTRDRQRAERSHAALQELATHQEALVESVSDALITTSLADTISNLNQAAADLLATTKAAAVGKPIAELVPGAQSSLKKAGSSQELTIQSPGGPPRTVVLTTTPIRSGSEQHGYLYVFQDITKLRTVEEQLQLQERMARLLAEKAHPTATRGRRIEQIVGESAVMRKVYGLIDRVAITDATVLICGESGTGKELAARAIHERSARRARPFVAVHCAAIPETLLESELFGHKRGAFTGAVADHQGFFREAEGGTIFLDEIGELPLQMQVKLLRTIQERTVRPVGGDRDIPVDVRIVAATNRSLKHEIAAGRFRDDLFYRLNVVSVTMPPLRTRKEDLPLLVNSILKRLVTRETVPIVPPATMQLLGQYSYPGNVRELENILERAVVLGGSVLLPEHLPEHLRGERSEHVVPGSEASNASDPSWRTTIIVDEDLQFPVKLDELLASIERRYLESALLKTNGARKRAAALLGMNFRSLRYRLQKFGIDPDHLDGEHPDD